MEKANVGFNGYLPNGLKVFYTFPLDTLADMVALAGHLGNVVALTDVMISQGFALQQPGLESGEKKEPIGWVLRREKEDGTPVIDLYVANERFTFRYVMHYLDTPEDIKTFEQTTGLVLNKIPLYVGDRLERNGKENSKKYIIPVAHPANAVIKDNPDYNPEETDVKKKKPARLFIRWVTEAATPTPPPPSQPATPPAVTGKVKTALGEDTTIDHSTGSIISAERVEPDYAALEVAERRKAVTALDNEAVTIYKVTYNATHNGMGAPSWTALAHDANGTSLPIVLWTEHVNLLKKAGYELQQDNVGLDITVITEVVGSERRIKSVVALDGKWMQLPAQNSANANVDVNSSNSDAPAWIFDRVKLLFQVGQRCPKVSFEERGSTVDKMHRENEFDKVGSLEGAVELVVRRLAAHKKEKVPA